MMLTDSHLHLTDLRFAGEVDDVVARARAAGVTRMVTVGTDRESSRAAAEIASRHPGVWATAGMHPHAAAHGASAIDRIEDLARHPRVVAIGETGLDYHYDHAPREAQRASFAAHLDLGRRLDLPVVVHAREADEDIIQMLRSNGVGTRGVMHCFAGGRAMLDAALEAGWYISFAGMVTFKRYDGEELVRAVPADRLLVETDSPYLAPVPHRGKRNEPAFVGRVAERLADFRGVPVSELAAQTTANAIALFALNH